MSKDKRNSKEWNKKFIKYVEEIVTHSNYDGLEIKKSKTGKYEWVTTKGSDVGKKRIKWALEKAEEYNLCKDETAVLSKVMREIHPTKETVCQICGSKLSVLYYYPNSSLIRAIEKKFGKTYDNCIHINEIWLDLLEQKFSEDEVSEFMIEKFKLQNGTFSQDRESILSMCEKKCRNGESKFLGPGAMSNFPDRFDGFHSYNRCCRGQEDKGRSKENLRTYGKDRRAFEYWVDGNIHAANTFMNSNYFKDISADHIGPISLGFVHDPAYIVPMSGGDNSAKRDRLTFEEITKIIRIENNTKTSPMSWFSKIIWEYIKDNYIENESKINGDYRKALKQNMLNYMEVLFIIIDECKENGEDYLFRIFIEPKYTYFKYKYKFDDNGMIIEKKERNLTDTHKNELNRHKRISFDSVRNFKSKENRNFKSNLSENHRKQLESICDDIKNKNDIKLVHNKIKELLECIQNNILNEL